MKKEKSYFIIFHGQIWLFLFSFFVSSKNFLYEVCHLEPQLLKTCSKSLNASEFKLLTEVRNTMTTTHMVFVQIPVEGMSHGHPPPAEAQSDRSSHSEEAPTCSISEKLKFGWRFQHSWQFVTLWWDGVY
jgi:hypothetical protein